MILDEIIDKTKIRLENNKKKYSLSNIKKDTLNLEIKQDFPFEKALGGEDISFICEVKKASPSKGLICKDFNHINIACDYENIGASAISVLTEPYFFKGSNVFLKEVSENVSLPTLRKDFIIDEYMIYEAKLLNANAILLIASILSEFQLKEYIGICDDLGLSALVEAHDKEEISKGLNAGARIIGVNNRNLKTFDVDINNSIKLREYVPSDVLFVSESGIKTHQDILNLKENNVNGVLIGETIVKSINRKETLNNLKNG